MQHAPMLDYLSKLRPGMQTKDFPVNDPLWELMSRAQKTMQKLLIEIRRQGAEANQSKRRQHSR